MTVSRSTFFVRKEDAFEALEDATRDEPNWAGMLFVAPIEPRALFDMTYVADLLPGLRAGAYGASFRFQVMREDLVQNPERSAYNPMQLPERTIVKRQ